MNKAMNKFWPGHEFSNTKVFIKEYRHENPYRANEIQFKASLSNSLRLILIL